MARVILVHRWQGSPGGDWYPWLKKELEERGHSVIVPEMPDPEHPNLHAWIAALAKAAGEVDENTFFVGHSIGCQTILRYLAHIPNQGITGGVILVAPWTRLTPESHESPADELISRPWREMPIPWELAKAHSKKFFCLFSDNDPFVYVDENKIFEQKLGAVTKIESRKGHFTEYDDCKELPSVLEELEKMVKS